MVTLDQPITDQWVGAFLHDSFMSWAARNSSKPGRSGAAERLVLHATPEWTSENWDRDGDIVAHEMVNEFWRVSGLSPQIPSQIQSHRWKYAIPVKPSKHGCYFDANSGIAACGDWASGSRVEGAFLSGMAAAGRVLGTLTTCAASSHNFGVPSEDQRCNVAESGS